MKTTHLLLLACTLLLASCETTSTYTAPPGWITTDNGATVWFRGKAAYEDQFIWSGPVDKNKFAHGFGILKIHNPETYGDPIFGGGMYANTTTYEGKMVAGKFEGEVNRIDSFNGKHQRDQWSDGTWLSGVVTRTGNSPSSGGSGFSDSQLVGGILGLGGIASGEAGLAGAGLSMVAGDDAGGMSQMTQWAGHEPGSTSTANSGTTKATGTATANKPNLIDKRRLRDTVKTGGDHMKYYIQAADQAFASYQKSGELAYYDQHVKYADLAQDFHNRTGTTTQGY